jgi:lipid-A-disaccharide synthase-like uncharacterized protein
MKPWFHWDVWLIVGFTAQGLFTGRFLIQWIASERRKESHIPVAFWYLSLAGGSLLLAYAVHRRDPVFILGQATGLVVYARNLHLILRKRQGEAAGPEPDSGAPGASSRSDL